MVALDDSSSSLPPLAISSRHRLMVRLRRSALLMPLVRRGHILPLGLFAALDVVMTRRLLFSNAFPAGMDSGFLYSSLTYFRSHDLHWFTIWLPEPLGQVQQYSVYWLLASLTAIVSDPVALYKAAVAATIYLAAAGAYGFAYSLTRSRLAAAVAGVLYVLAPYSVGTWLLGHLDVGVSYAVGPFAVWALWNSLRSGSVRAMIGLGLAGSALFLLTTGQGLYWLLPLACVVAAEIVRPSGGTTRPIVARRLVATVALSCVSFAVASSVQLVSYALGLKAAFVAGGQPYYIQRLEVHEKYSLPFLDNVLGVPLAYRYLATGVPIAVAPFHSWPFRVEAGILLALALAAILTRHRPVALALVVPAVVAWFLASGPRGVAGSAYVFVYDHLPFFSFLRVPNRWVMVAVLAQAVLVALAVAGFRGERRWARALWPSVGAGLAAWALVLAVFSARFALFHGLPTWRPPSAYPAAYRSVAADRSDSRLLTTPYFQAWMATGEPYNDAVGLAADLGVVSTLWHGHAGLDRGGWDPRAAKFARYVYELIKQGTTRSLAKVVGAVDVAHIGLNPHVAVEVAAGQNRFFQRQLGLRLVRREGRIEIYRNVYALPQAFVTPRACIVAGGLHVLGDLAQQRSFSFARTTLQFADELAALQGADGLRSALRSSSCLIIAPGGAVALGVLLAAVDTADAARFAPRSWFGAPTSPMLDIDADATTAVAVPPGSVLHGTLRAPRPGRYRLWVAALVGPDQGQVRLELGAHAAGALRLQASGGTAVRWRPGRVVHLAAGPHDFAVTNASRTVDAQVTRVALVPASAGAWRMRATAAPHVIREHGGVGPLATSSIVLGRPLRLGPWRTLAPEGYVQARTEKPTRVWLHVRRGGRRYFGIVQADARGNIDPWRPFAIRFRGAGTGLTFYLTFSFRNHEQADVGFRFRDTTTATRLLVFSPLQPSFTNVVPDWSHLGRVTLSTTSKVRWARPVQLAGPFEIANANLRPTFVGAGEGDPFTRDSRVVSALASDDERIDVHVPLRRRVPPGTLVFTQAYNPEWRLRGSGARNAPHSIALGFANAYALRRPVEDPSLEFEAARWGQIASFGSLGAWLLGLAIVALPSPRRVPVRWRLRRRGRTRGS